MALALEPIAPHHVKDLMPLAEALTPREAEDHFPLEPASLPKWIESARERHESDLEKTYAVMADGRPVGLCRLFDFKDDDQSAELGFWIGKPYWGRGYAGSAGRLALAAAFNQHGRQIVRAHCLLTNRAAQAALESMGFHLTSVHDKTDQTGQAHRIAYFEQKRQLWETGQGV